MEEGPGDEAINREDSNCEGSFFLKEELKLLFLLTMEKHEKALIK